MASNTPNLQLYKVDPVADGNELFDIEKMLNGNWDKIDTAVDRALKSLGKTYVWVGNGVTATATQGGDVRTAVGGSDGFAVFTGLPLGKWAFRATVGGSSRQKSVMLSVLGISYICLTTLSGASWAEIDAFAKVGAAPSAFQRGDRKTVNLSGIGNMTLEIADFNHDFLSGSTGAARAPITFITKNLLYTTYQMNPTDTNVGGFPSSALQSTLNGTIFNTLPADLRSVVKTCYKCYVTGNDTTNGKWWGGKLWLPLSAELFESPAYAPGTEVTTGGARQYPIFTSNASRIKKLSNGSGSANYYWLASPDASNATDFCIVGSDGTDNSRGASHSYGVCFGLCV